MDFIEWCDHVLDSLIDLASASLDARTMGADEFALAGRIFGDERARSAEFYDSKARVGMHDALRELTAHYLIEARQGHFFRPTSQGERFTLDKTPLWETLCGRSLKPEQEQLLRLVNCLSPHAAQDHAYLEAINQDRLLPDLNWDEGFELLYAVAQELDEHGLVRRDTRIGRYLELESTYTGLVWEFRQGFTLASRFIDDLVTQWETTSVDFKRELRTNTADEKAELIKDVTALANTQASGQRFLIVGFDDKTRGYHGPPGAKITQEHLEQLMSQYVTPVIDIRYEVVDYRAGHVGKLEVLRNPEKLPYRVAKSIGEKKRINAADVFVRHGSLTEPPTEGELQAIEAEGKRARGDEVEDQIQ